MTLRLCAGENCLRCDSCERYTREPDSMSEFETMIIPDAATPLDGCDLFMSSSIAKEAAVNG